MRRALSRVVDVVPVSPRGAGDAEAAPGKKPDDEGIGKRLLDCSAAVMGVAGADGERGRRRWGEGQGGRMEQGGEGAWTGAEARERGEGRAPGGRGGGWCVSGEIFEL